MGRLRSSSRPNPSAHGGGAGAPGFRRRDSSEPALSGPHPPLLPSTFLTEDDLNRVCPFYVSNRTDPTYRTLRPATTEAHPTKESDEIMTFTFYLLAELFPSFSDFFMKVLGRYQLRMARLSANSVLSLAIFTHLCEAFAWVMSSVCVFQRLFRVTLHSGSDDLVGSVWFGIRDRNLYIEQGLSGKVDEWKKHLMYLSSDSIRNHLRFLHQIPEHVVDYWEQLPKKDAWLEPVFQHIQALKAVGLEGSHVVYDFLVNRISLLRLRPKPSWMYTD